MLKRTTDKEKTYQVTRKMIPVRNRERFAQLVKESKGSLNFSERRGLPTG
jgi:hypothetical protein